MEDERYSVAEWFTTPPRTEQVGRALVLPGAGYTVDHPVLFWGCQVLAQLGWRVVIMRWRADANAGDPRAFVEAGADRLDAEAGPGSRTLILAKSLGSYAAGWASQRGYPAVWLTPIFTDHGVTEALSHYSAEALLIGGTRDPVWDSQRARGTGLQILELPGADHSLHLASDWRGSIRTLEQTLIEIERFAASACL